MKKALATAALLLLFTTAFAQGYNPATGQSYDQYGRPLPTIESLCKEGQMAGGPITPQCAMYGYRFNEKGERMVRYDFKKWGYNLLSLVPEATATKLDADPKFRAAYIKSRKLKTYTPRAESEDDAIGERNGQLFTRSDQRAFCSDSANKHDPRCR